MGFDKYVEKVEAEVSSTCQFTKIEIQVFMCEKIRRMNEMLNQLCNKKDYEIIELRAHLEMLTENHEISN